MQANNRDRRGGHMLSTPLAPPDGYSINVALRVLTTKTQKQAPAVAREILARSQATALSPAQKQVIIDTVTTIITYRFGNRSRQEIVKMLGITLQETRAYQEAYQEAQHEKARSLALKMLQEGATFDFVVKVTGFSVEQLQQFQAEANLEQQSS